MNKMTRRAFGATAGAILLLPQLWTRDTAAADDHGVTGPLVGHVSESSAHLWYRPGIAGTYTLAITDDVGAILKTTAEAKEHDDFCVTWAMDQLKPGARYRYSITDQDGKRVAGGGDDDAFQTAPDPDELGTVCLAFGSCARTKPLKLWQQMHEQGAQGVVLLGDTPYIDSTDLDVQRR